MENKKPYKEGTIKLTWVNPDDFTLLNSDMFKNVEDAIKTADKRGLGKKYLIMKLVKTDGNRYEWMVLNEGEYQQYISGVNIINNPYLKYGSIFLAGLGAMYIIELLLGKK